MNKKNIKLPSVLIISIILTLGLSIALQSILAAWIAPTAAPPGSNISAPINVSATAQTKTGDLTVTNNLSTGSNLAVGGDAALDGNFTVGTDTFFVDESGTGRVGIGTDAPGDRLHVYGGNSTERIRVQNSSSGQASIDLQNSSKVYRVIIDGANLIFYDDSANKRRMMIATNGYVGIGDIIPGSELDVDGTIRATEICNRAGSVCNSTSDTWSGGGSDTDWLYSSGTGVDGDIYHTGDVGIGTISNPSAQLDISNSSGKGGAVFQGTGDDWNYSQLTLKNSNTGGSSWNLQNRQYDGGFPEDGSFMIEEFDGASTFTARIAIKATGQDEGRIYLNPVPPGGVGYPTGVSIGSMHTNSPTDDIGDLQVHRETNDKPAMVLIDGKGDEDNYATLVLMEYRESQAYLAPRWSINHRNYKDIDGFRHGLAFNYDPDGSSASDMMIIDTNGNIKTTGTLKTDSECGIPGAVLQFERSNVLAPSYMAAGDSSPYGIPMACKGKVNAMSVQCDGADISNTANFYVRIANVYNGCNTNDHGPSVNESGKGFTVSGTDCGPQSFAKDDVVGCWSEAALGSPGNCTCAIYVSFD